MSETVSNGANGERDGGGKFTKGNRGGPGNPGVKHAADLRKRLDDALRITCTKKRLLNAISAILKAAEQGDVQAMKLIIERISGPPADRSMIERIEALEAQQERQRCV